MVTVFVRMRTKMYLKSSLELRIEKEEEGRQFTKNDEKLRKMNLRTYILESNNVEEIKRVNSFV